MYKSKEKRTKYMRKWFKDNKKEWDKYISEYYKKLRLEVLGHYSGGIPKCANPYGLHKEPFIDMRCLQIDHINGGGNKQIKKLNINAGHGLCQWLKKHNYPPNVQVLCANCNWIKRYENNEVKCKTPKYI